MPPDPNRIANMFRKLSPADDEGPRRRSVPTAWIVGLVALLSLTLPLAVFGSVFDSGDDGADADLSAVRVNAAEADDDEPRDDDRGPAGGDPTVRETIDGNTQRDGAYSITGNTKIGDTTERPTQDGNTGRDGANSITGNTKIGDTTERPTQDGNTGRNGANSISGNTRGADTTRAGAAAAPAASGFAPAYDPAGGSVSGASASASG